MNCTSSPKMKIAPIPVRGHTLLCLQGFRGEGYDQVFTAHMSEIHQQLQKQPGLLVRVITRPDTFCHKCPNLSPDQGCKLHGEGTEPNIVRQDKAVMERLGILNEEVLKWEEVLQKIKVKFKPSMLDELCGKCPWLPLGYCKSGLLQITSLEGASLLSPRPKKE